MGVEHRSEVGSDRLGQDSVMIEQGNSVLKLVELMQRRAPEYLDLFAAANDGEFEEAFDQLLEQSLAQIEQNARNFKCLNEEGLTAVLAGRLTVPGLVVTQETNSNGHVDITIEIDHSSPARRKLGEAKIYRGPQYHIEGLIQLLGRYTTGRESRGLLIEYVRQQDIKNLMKAIRDRMDVDQPIGQQGGTKDLTLKWSFASSHSHSSGEVVQVGHYACNLYTD